MNIKNSLLGAAIVSVATVATAAPSYALETLMGNFPTGNFAATSTISATQTKAVGFTTPATGELDLSNVDLWLVGYDNNDVADITIRQGSDPASATTVATLGNPVPTPNSLGILQEFSFTPTTQFTFSPSTSYFLYVDSASGEYNWAIDENGLPPGATGETATGTTPQLPSGTATFDGYQFSSNDGATFSNSSLANSFQIQTDSASAAVPFDFSATPGLFLIGGLWGANKLRRRKSSAKLIED